MKRTRLRAQSSKQARKEREFARNRDKVIRRAGGRCEIRVGMVCRSVAATAHHVRLRSQGGGHDVDNLVATCNACHRYVHEHPEWARENGWIG